MINLSGTGISHLFAGTCLAKGIAMADGLVVKCILCLSAVVVQLVECFLPKEEIASSSLVYRSICSYINNPND